MLPVLQGPASQRTAASEGISPTTRPQVAHLRMCSAGRACSNVALGGWMA